jgi:hypothetical protein
MGETSMPQPSVCTLVIHAFDGSRQPLTAGVEPLFTIHDGNQRQVYREFAKSSSLRLTDLPFFDNFGDNYTVVAWAPGFEQAGFTPVPVRPNIPGQVDIMLLKQSATFNFNQARWDLLDRNAPDAKALLAAGAASDEEAQNRYADLRENRGPTLACFFNLTTAMSQIHLPSGSPMDYLKELIWDDMAPDRFFAWADPKLADQVRLAARQGAFSPEIGTALFHPGATSSFKQVQFGEANVQLTFHENDKKTVDGQDCIKVEPDMDYFKDLAAHALLEVLHNKAVGTLTDPRQVYVLRWIAGRQAGVPAFNPPFTIS